MDVPVCRIHLVRQGAGAVSISPRLTQECAQTLLLEAVLLYSVIIGLVLGGIRTFLCI